jgi:hypothetical protein
MGIIVESLKIYNGVSLVYLFGGNAGNFVSSPQPEGRWFESNSRYQHKVKESTIASINF